MEIVRKTIDQLTIGIRYLSLLTMTLMMLFIALAVTSRFFAKPIVGDIELVQLGMVILIMCGLAYTEQINGHIRIDVFEKFLPKKLTDIISYIITIMVTFLLAYIYFNVALKHKNNMVLSTDLLGIKYYPFQFFVCLGFFMWGLQALTKLIGIFMNENEGATEGE